MDRKGKEQGNLVRIEDVHDYLYRAAWKLQGVSGLFKLETNNLQLDNAEAYGIGFLLEQLADDILGYAKIVDEYTTHNLLPRGNG
ncbi:MAG TPA: hypothetical protein PLO63_11610 [Syntrophales bacterium]|nr:hypothetical protein [Syntrophales bacterium]